MEANSGKWHSPEVKVQGNFEKDVIKSFNSGMRLFIYIFIQQRLKLVLCARNPEGLGI